MYICIIFKDKKSKKSHKALGIKVFITIFARWKKDPEPDPDPYLWLMDPDPEGPKTCGSGTSESGFWSGSATLQVKKSQDITNFDWTEAEKYCHFYAMPSVGISQINHFFNDCWHIASEINHIHLKINKHASHPFTPAQCMNTPALSFTLPLSDAPARKIILRSTLWDL
jgi:hypothetical protein